MANHITQPRTYYLIFALLIALTLVTVGIDILGKRQGGESFQLGAVQTPFVLLIATIKAGVVILFFMHVWYSSKLTWAVALGSLLWLGILISYTMTDYMSRQWIHVPGH